LVPYVVQRAINFSMVQTATSWLPAMEATIKGALAGLATLPGLSRPYDLK